MTSVSSGPNDLPALRHEAAGADRIVRCFVDRPASLYAMFERSLHRRGEAEMLVCEGRRWSWREAAVEVERHAAALHAGGMARGDRVALFMGNRPEFVWTLLALARLGAIAVPIGIREPGPGLAYMLAQCGARGIVFDPELAQRIPDHAASPVLALRAEAGFAASMVAADPPPPVQVAEHDVAAILYTSGTTGSPKGAMLTHFNIAHSVLHLAHGMGLSAADRSLLAVPASHVTGLVANLATMLHMGGTTIVLPAFKAADFIALVQRERATHTLMVPAMYALCLLQPGFAQADLSAWRVGGYGGAPMPVATIDALAAALPGLVLQNAYGATETTSPTTMMPPGLTRAHADSVGRALPCADIRVMDDAGRELPPGEQGELWIGGPMVVPGYWDNPAATAASFSAGFWHSGDIGSVDAQGFVRIFDRKKDMLNRGGFKVYSVEVENVLMAFDGVVEAAIVGRPCPVLGERVHAFVHAPGIAPDEAMLRRHCAERLADYKVPETITWSAQPLPRNANGKLLKRLLRERTD